MKNFDDTHNTYRIKFDSFSQSYVLTDKKEDEEHIKFDFSPRIFAQKFFYKMGETVPVDEGEREGEQPIDEEIEVEEPCDKTSREKDYERKPCDNEEKDRCDKEKSKKCPDEKKKEERDGCREIKRKRGMFFRQGMEADEEDVEGLQEEFATPQLNLQPPQPSRQSFPPQRPPQFPPQRPPQNNLPAEISKDIYNKLLVLNALYQDLINFNTQYTSQIKEMMDELRIVTFAILRIYQNLSGRNNIPLQNQRKPQFSSFCNGVVVTMNYLRGIMFDIRRLQRLVEINNIDRQLIIINFTLQSQQSQLQQMREDCIEGGRL